MKVLVTGVAGFLGSRFAEWILRTHPEVEIVGIDDMSCGYIENVPDGVKLVARYTLGSTDMRDDWYFEDGGWASALEQTYDYVFHFAAYAAEGLSPFIRQYNYRNNLLATAEVVNLCINQGCGRLVFLSSMAVYGPGRPPFGEYDQCRPIDPYGVSKLACEMDIQCACAQHGLDFCIIRPHNLFGPGQSIWQVFRNVLGNWMARALAGEPLLVYGTGEQQRAFSWIDDCLPCLWEAAVSPKASQRVINLGGEQETTIKAAAELVSEITGAPIEYAAPRHEVRQAWCTTQLSKNVLGYQESIDLRTGLERMWEWAKVAWEEFPERRGTHEVAPLEVTKGLYPYWREAGESQRPTKLDALMAAVRGKIPA